MTVTKSPFEEVKCPGPGIASGPSVPGEVVGGGFLLVSPEDGLPAAEPPTPATFGSRDSQVLIASTIMRSPRLANSPLSKRLAAIGSLRYTRNGPSAGV